MTNVPGRGRWGMRHVRLGHTLRGPAHPSQRVFDRQVRFVILDVGGAAIAGGLAVLVGNPVAFVFLVVAVAAFAVAAIYTVRGTYHLGKADMLRELGILRERELRWLDGDDPPA